MRPTARQFTLPDLFSICPLQDATNPANAPSSFKAPTNSCARMFTHTPATSNSEPGQVNLLFVVDEISDDQNGQDARATGRIFVNAMRDAHWDDGSILAKITHEFRERFVRLAGPKTVRRFADLCESYTDCVAREAELRERNQVLGLNDFIALRRQNSAVLLCYSLVEYILGIDLDDEVYEDPTFAKAYWAACDFVCWANDVYSYDMEQAKGHTGNNVVTVLMKEKDLSLQEASDYIGRECEKQMRDYLEAKSQLLQSTDLPQEAVRYIEALGYWMVGNLVWSFESQRYFGAQHERVKATHVVHLRPSSVLEASCDSDSDSDC